jgi:hypothetical protein
MSRTVVVAKVLVTAGLIFAVLGNIDLTDLRTTLLRANPILLGLATILYALTFVVGGARWHGINTAYGHSTNLGFCIRTFFVAGFFSQFMVGGGYGGDVYRVWTQARVTSQPLEAFVAVLVDRASGLLVAVLLVASLAPVYRLLFPDHAQQLLGISMVCLAGLAVLFLLAWAGRAHADHGLGETRAGLAWQKLKNASANLAKGFLRWPATLIHLGWSLVALILGMLALAAIGSAIGVSLDLVTYLTLGPIVFLAKSFPLSFAGWGAREAAMVYFFGFAGVSGTNAMAISLLAGLLVLMASLVGGVIWLTGRDAEWRVRAAQ